MILISASAITTDVKKEDILFQGTFAELLDKPNKWFLETLDPCVHVWIRMRDGRNTMDLKLTSASMLKALKGKK